MRPIHGTHAPYQDDPHWRDVVLFNEYFHGEGWLLAADPTIPEAARSEVPA